MMNLHFQTKNSIHKNLLPSLQQFTLFNYWDFHMTYLFKRVLLAIL